MRILEHPATLTECPAGPGRRGGSSSPASSPAIFFAYTPVKRRTRCRGSGSRNSQSALTPWGVDQLPGAAAAANAPVSLLNLPGLRAGAFCPSVGASGRGDFPNRCGGAGRILPRVAWRSATADGPYPYCATCRPRPIARSWAVACRSVTRHPRGCGDAPLLPRHSVQLARRSAEWRAFCGVA